MDYQALVVELMEKMYIINRAKPHKRLSECMQGEPFVLQYLAFQDGAALPSEISKFMKISSARIAVALNNLEKKGLITRRIDINDRRRILVELTPKGKTQVDKVKRQMVESFTQIISQLGEEDAKEYVRITGRLSEIVSKYTYSE
ncbi:MAG: transcriptional regulator [Clostridiaceae bacterium]|nr:transcriptional regulator [Clostridiaceae bacterium]